MITLTDRDALTALDNREEDFIAAMNIVNMAFDIVERERCNDQGMIAQANEIKKRYEQLKSHYGFSMARIKATAEYLLEII